MKAYQIELMVLDFDGLGSDGIKAEIENTRYANRCIKPEVMACEERDIGEWSDEHPLNQSDKADAEYHRLFSSNEREARDEKAEDEVARLLEWQRLHDSAPEEAKGVILDRLREANAIAPIVESWKAEVVRLTEELRQEQERNKLNVAQADTETARLREEKVVAFVQGAQWWEYAKAKATMWASDRNRAEAEAVSKQQAGTLGVLAGWRARMKVYLTFKNADMTEGRGPMLPDRCFLKRTDAERYIDSMPGVMGMRAKWSKQKYGDWAIQEIIVEEEWTAMEWIVEEDGKPARYPECHVHPSWSNCEFATFEEAEAYALKWLGMHSPGKGQIEPNVPFEFCGNGQLMIRKKEGKH